MIPGHVLSYEEVYGLIVTDCPHRVCLLVGSVKCQRCPHHIAQDKEMRNVICGYVDESPAVVGVEVKA